MLGNSKSFSKNDTLIIKGIAILLMVYHHLFVIPDRLQNNYISVINLTGFDFQSYIANFCKICVCIYVFCSGIGQYYSLIKLNSLKEMYKKTFIHALKFMINFWVILLFVYPIGHKLNNPSFALNFKSIIKACIASGGAMEWWFVKFYLPLLLVSPLIIQCFKNVEKIKKSVLLLYVFAILIINRNVIILFKDTNEIINEIYVFINTFDNFELNMAFITGVLCAKYDLIRIFRNVSGYKKYILCFGSIFISLYIRIAFCNAPAMKVDFIVVPLFILPLISILENENIKNLLEFFGKHSTNIWLTHTFWCYYFGQKIVLIPKYSILIYLWLLLLSLISSYIINLVHVPLHNLLFDKEHKISFKGYI